MAPDMSLFFGSVLLCCIRPLTSLSYQETNSQMNTNYPDDSYNTDPKWRNEHCQGQRQSPINIENHLVNVNDNRSLVTLVNYSALILDYRIRMAHQSVNLILPSGGNEKLVIKRFDGGDIVETEYILHSFHFHWNCTEHLFESKRQALELHFVHYNRKFENFEQAGQKEGGLAVFAVLFELRDRDNFVLDLLLDMIKSKSSNSSLHHSTVHFNDFFPDPGFFVYQYDGSLTTVPCYETVRWNVASKLNYVSVRQIMEFQRLYPITMNCRRPQERFNRQIQEITVKIFNVGGASIASWQFKLHAFTIFLTIYLSKNILC